MFSCPVNSTYTAIMADNGNTNLVRSLEERKRRIGSSEVEFKPVQCFEDLLEQLSKEEILLEYLKYIRTLPDLLEVEKNKIVEQVKDELGIGQILSEVQTYNFESVMHKERGQHLMDHLSTKLGYSLNILCPPVNACILCERKLTMNNKPSQVVVHNVTGPRIYSKYIYRCRGCKLVQKSKVDKAAKTNAQDIYYHSDRYGNLKTGWLFYNKNQPTFIKASNEVFFHRRLVQSYVNNLCHAWMSMEGQAEAYNQTWLSSEEVMMVKLFLAKNPEVGKHFNQKIKTINPEEDLEFPENENCNESESRKKEQPMFTGMAEMHRKSLSQVKIIFYCFD